MKDTPTLAWNAIKNYYEKYKNNSLSRVNFKYDSKENFINTFEAKYNEIKTSYMRSTIGNLDRHKQAAILLYCTIKNKVFEYNDKIESDKIFVGCEQVGLLLCLSYMKDMLNNILEEINEKPIDKYTFPTAFSCETEYFDILTRDIYLQGYKDDGVYILFLANILYFIEYDTLKEINPDLIIKIKEYTKIKSQEQEKTSLN